MKEFILKYKFIIIAVAVLSTFLIGGTYAWINIELFGEKTNKIIAGTLELELDESTCTEINITNATPINDEEGMKQVACTFTLENTGTLDSDYTIYLDDEELLSGETRMNDNDVKYSLMKNSSNKIEYLSQTGTHPNRVVDNGILTTGSSNSYELRLWIASDASVDAMGKTVATTIRVTSGVYQPVQCSSLTDYNDEANPPELVGDMIPVIYDEATSAWVKADSNNSSNNWYNYDEQEWANAVTVTEANRATHVAAAVGTIIPIADINTFMVWIPRYAYTIKDTYGYQGYGGSTPSVTTPGAFDIRFTRSDTTCLGSAEYMGDTAENWFTNSAFCWGNSCDVESTRDNPENRELSGIWVAKFESSTTDTTCPSSASSSNCNKILQPISLPSVHSWRDVNISNMFYSTQQYMNNANGETIYGLTGLTYDAHMMKNTEWGAVAYLTQSRYGKYGNEDYTGSNKEVAINNCSSFITGIAGDSVSASSSSSSCSTNFYNTKIGESASTTGNIYGIYDMSGGSSEYVMGNMQNSSGNFYSMLSGFAIVPESKYYNNYIYGIEYEGLTRYIKGDATKEMMEFYSDYYYFVNVESPWFLRGGHYNYKDNSSVGVTMVSSNNGYFNAYHSFRITLVP